MNRTRGWAWFGSITGGGEESSDQECWAQTCAGLGAVVWAALAVLARVEIARIGAIELMFAFAPLVIVPLGIELGNLLGTEGSVNRVARKIQPAGAVLAVLALCLPQGKIAGVMACGWMVVCGLMGLSGVLELCSFLKERFSHSGRKSKSPPCLAKGAQDKDGARRDTRSFDYTASDEFASLRMTTLSESSTSVPSPTVRVAMVMARIDLAVGGAWFVASRLGMRPMGIQEPIGLLTAVHFHFAGFATAMIAAATLHFAEQHGEGRWLRRLIPLVIGMPFVVALGFVVSPTLKMVAGIIFSASVSALAIFVRSYGRKGENGTARLLLQVAAVSVFAGMMFSSAYAVADYLGSDVLTIPQMARTHGIFNAVGFCLPAMLGWIVEFSVPVSGRVGSQLS